MTMHENPDAAEPILRKIAELRPNSVFALYNLAVLISDNHPEPREAISYLEKVYHQNPWWYDPIFTLGRTYYSLGEYEKALAYYQATEMFTRLRKDYLFICISPMNNPK